jgi:hypothetical protein
MAEVVVGALLLGRLCGRRGGVDRADQVIGMFGALSGASAIGGTVGTVTMLVAGVIDAAEASSPR